MDLTEKIPLNKGDEGKLAEKIPLDKELEYLEKLPGISIRKDLVIDLPLNIKGYQDYLEKIKIRNEQTFVEEIPWDDIINSDSQIINLKPANPEKVINDLKDYKTKKWNIGGNEIPFDKKGMKHVLERHHPENWNGSVKKHNPSLIKICLLQIF